MMFGFFFRTPLALINNNCSSISLLDISKTQLLRCTLPLNSNALIRRCLSSLKQAEDEDKKQSFTISYLINSCGLSPDSAKSVSRHLLFDNPTKPYSFLSLLRDLGLSQITHISKIIRGQTQLLVIDVDKTILPKIQFLRSIGFSTKDLQILITRNSGILTRSLDQFLIPCHNILTSLHLSDQEVVTFLKRAGFRTTNSLNSLNVNISFLRGLGMPQSIISLFLTRCPSSVCLDADKFKQGVEMGFDPKNYTFVSAVIAKLNLLPGTWKRKVDAFKKWGSSEDEILSTFRKHPICMHLSDESITNKMDFLVNKMGWQPAVVLRYPVIICCSSEKRIVQRCSVIRVLLLKGLIKSKISLSWVIKPTDSRFLHKYVINHQDQVPELMDIFQGKIALKELGFGFDEKCTAGASLVYQSASK